MARASPAGDGGVPVAPAAVGVGDVVAGQLRPGGFVFDADRMAAVVDGFDEGGAAAAHRVDDQVAGVGVGGDGLGGDGRQHFAGMGAAVGQVAAGALGLGGALPGQPHARADGRCRVAHWPLTTRR